MRGTFGWIGAKFIVSLAMDSDIYFPTRCCNSLEHKLHSAASSSFFAEYSKNLFAFCQRSFLNFELRAWRSKVLFSNPMLYWRIIKTMYGISPDRRIPVRIDILIYWFTPSTQWHHARVTYRWQRMTPAGSTVFPTTISQTSTIYTHTPKIQYSYSQFHINILL